MTSYPELKIPDIYNIPFGNIKKSVFNFFDTEMQKS